MSTAKCSPTQSQNLLDNHLLEREHYRQLQCKFQRACQQVILLDNRINDMELRLERMLASGRRAHSFIVHFNLATMDGVRNMMNEWAIRAEEELDELHNKIVQLVE